MMVGEWMKCATYIGTTEGKDKVLDGKIPPQVSLSRVRYIQQKEKRVRYKNAPIQSEREWARGVYMDDT